MQFFKIPIFSLSLEESIVNQTFRDYFSKKCVDIQLIRTLAGEQFKNNTQEDAAEFIRALSDLSPSLRFVQF